jgi:hypothetical protein
MKKDRVPELMVERLALGELPPDEAARVRAGLGEDAQARLEALAEDDAEQLRRLPPSRVAAEVERRLARSNRRAPARGGVPLWIPAIALGAAAVAAWLWLRPSVSPPPADPIARSDAAPPGLDGGETSEIVYVKGDARLWIDRLGRAGAERLASGDSVQSGDRLQVHYDAADRELGVIVSIDGRGAVTLHSPSEPGDAALLSSGGGVALDHSYELDDAPGFERFFFVTAPRGSDLDVAAVMDAARALAATPNAETAPLPIDDGLAQTSILLEKAAG